MASLTWRLALYAGSLLVMVAIYTWAYRFGMAAFEGEARTWIESFEIVVQSMTTTGYGQDAPWESGPMTAFVILVQLTGIAYIFVAVPLFVVPWLEGLVEPAPPTAVEAQTDHVVIVGDTPLTEPVREELDARDIPVLILEPDEEHARALHEAELPVVHGDPTVASDLQAASVPDARAVVIDATGESHVSGVLAVADQGPDVQVVAIITEQERARYLRYAGADEVLSPRHHLGKAIADRIVGPVETDLAGAFGTDGGIEIAELPVPLDSHLFGRPVRAVSQLEETGATVLGLWLRGEFVVEWRTDVPIDETATLLLAGTQAQLDTVGDMVGAGWRSYPWNAGPVVVLGAGAVAATAVGGLERAGVETQRLAAGDTGSPIASLGEDTAPDIVGDPTTEDEQRAVGVEKAGTVVVALDDDEKTILATLVARELNPEARLLATLGRSESVGRLRTAGIDEAIAVPSVAGRLVVEVLTERPLVASATTLRITAVDASSLRNGPSLDAIRDETGCTVIGQLRDGTIEPLFGSLDGSETVVVAGTPDNLENL